MGFNSPRTDTKEKNITNKHTSSSGTENRNNHENVCSEVIALNAPCINGILMIKP